MAQAKSTFQQMNRIPTNLKIEMNVRRKVLESYVEPVFLYKCETWTINEATKKSLGGNGDVVYKKNN